MTATHRLPLHIRLSTTVAVALLITAMLSVVPLYWHAKSKVATEMQAALNVGEQVVQNELLLQSTGPNSARHLNSMLTHFNGDRHLRVTLVDAKGHPVARSNLAPPEDRAPKWFQNFIDVTPLIKEIKLPTFVGTATHVRLEADPNNEIGEAWSDLANVIAILALFCLLILLSVWWIVTRALAPISTLLNGYSDIASGNLTARVTPDGSPEIARLCQGFNDMSTALEYMAARNTRLSQQLEDLQEEERADLARDLHDEVSPLLFAADVDAAMLTRLAAARDHDDMVEQTNAIRAAIKQLKKTVTIILGNLRPALLLDQGLHVAIENLISSHRRRHADVKFETAIDDADMSDKVTGALFYVAREAIANALRHGSPSCISISLHKDDGNSISLVVEDNGCGFEDSGSARGFGLRGMHERIESAGGSLIISTPEDGSGTRICARIPCTAHLGASHPRTVQTAKPLAPAGLADTQHTPLKAKRPDENITR